jgi:hypothetical protein
MEFANGPNPEPMNSVKWEIYLGDNRTSSFKKLVVFILVTKDASGGVVGLSQGDLRPPDCRLPCISYASRASYDVAGKSYT